MNALRPLTAYELTEGYDAHEAAKWWGVHVDTFRDEARDRQIPFYYPTKGERAKRWRLCDLIAARDGATMTEGTTIGMPIEEAAKIHRRR